MSLALAQIITKKGCIIMPTEILSKLKPFYGFARTANEGTDKARDYIVLLSEKPQTTTLDGVEIQASFKDGNANVMQRIYLEITHTQFQELCEKNGSNVFYACKLGDKTTIMSDAKYQQAMDSIQAS